MTKKKIILDTNFLLIPGMFRVDIFSEIARVCEFDYELCIIDRSLEELEGLSRGSGKAAGNAKLALSLLRTKSVKLIKTSTLAKSADDAILNAAASAPESTVVATQDGPLKRSLRGLSVPLLVLRQKRHVQLIGG